MPICIFNIIFLKIYIQIKKTPKGVPPHKISPEAEITPLYSRTKKELIARTTLPGQYIYDPFAGSGSTIEAAAEMKVFSIGCEIDVKSYAAMITRMQVWKEKVSK